MLNGKIDDAKRKVAEIDEALRGLGRLRSHLASEEYRATVGKWISNHIEPLRDRLEQPDLQPGETTAIRAQIKVWRELDGLHDRTVAEMESLADKAAGLQKKLEEWHDRGRGDLGSTVETVSRIAKPRPRRTR